jgi:hypothetical protein
VRGRLLPTPFVASFVGQAHPGDLADPDPHRRTVAWAHWAVGALSEMRGVQDRAYYALTLDGRFYDPKGTGPRVRPHLELPSWQLAKPDPEFPTRLAQMGNGLSFPWWVAAEVTAARRALFNTTKGSVFDVSQVLNRHRDMLIRAVTQLRTVTYPQWSTIEALLISSPDGLCHEATDDVPDTEVAEFFPGGAELRLSVVYDNKLREQNPRWASRRVGVWQLRGTTRGGERFSLGVLTPRLTANSLFRDPLFSPDRESPAALLVRGLVLARLTRTRLRTHGHIRVGAAAVEPEHRPGPCLRAVVAKIGTKLPEASTEAAIRFLQAYPDPDAAWRRLAHWATTNGAALTVTEDGFKAAHRNALRYLRRAEDPERADINIVLPLAWDQQARVVRVTFARPRGSAGE